MFCSSTSVVAGADELIVDDWLNTGLSASDVVAHGVKASLGGVDFDNAFECRLAAGQFVFVVFALGLALFEKKSFRILSVLQHLVNVDLGVQVWCKSRFMYHPTWGKPSGNSSAHLFVWLF